MKTRSMLLMTVVATGIIGARADAQNIFVSDFWADSIYYFTPDNVRHTFATGLNRPAGIAFDQTGNLFVSDYHSGNLYKYTPDGVRSTFASGLASSRVWGIAFDQAGNLYGAASDVGVPGYGSVFKWTTSGQRSTFASGLYGPSVLAFDSADNLYVNNLGNNVFTDTILKFTLDGARSTFASGLFNTTGMAFDSAGNLFVQDAYAGSSIYKITPGGVRTTFAPYYGISLGFDSAGRLLQGDDYGNIYLISPEGTRTLYASGLARPSSFALQVPEPPVCLILCLGSVVLFGGVRRRDAARDDKVAQTRTSVTIDTAGDGLIRGAPGAELKDSTGAVELVGGGAARPAQGAPGQSGDRAPAAAGDGHELELDRPPAGDGDLDPCVEPAQRASRRFTRSGGAAVVSIVRTPA